MAIYNDLPKRGTFRMGNEVLRLPMAVSHITAYSGLRTQDAAKVAERRAAEPHRTGKGRKLGQFVFEAQAPLPNVTHGTTTAYQRGCRCVECKTEMNAYQREYKRRRAAGEITPARWRGQARTDYGDKVEVHGTHYRYRLGCRCEWCRQIPHAKGNPEFKRSLVHVVTVAS